MWNVGSGSEVAHTPHTSSPSRNRRTSPRQQEAWWGEDSGTSGKRWHARVSKRESLGWRRGWSETALRSSDRAVKAASASKEAEFRRADGREFGRRPKDAAARQSRCVRHEEPSGPTIGARGTRRAEGAPLAANPSPRRRCGARGSVRARRGRQHPPGLRWTPRCSRRGRPTFVWSNAHQGVGDVDRMWCTSLGYGGAVCAPRIPARPRTPPRPLTRCSSRSGHARHIQARHIHPGHGDQADVRPRFVYEELDVPKEYAGGSGRYTGGWGQRPTMVVAGLPKRCLV